MKKQIFYTLLLLLALQACKKIETPLTGSNLDVTNSVLNKTDKWLRSNFTDSYNIDVSYKWNENKVDLNRYLYPPKIENVIPVASIVKTVWLDAYNEVGGKNFIKKIAPRQIIIVGGKNKNPSGTVNLGLAEGGKSITLFEADLINVKNKADLLGFVGTIQHEYTHILNQTKPFDERNYEKITPVGYTAQWNNRRLSESRELGFITKYARAEPKEDFAEMVKTMLSNTKTEYDAIISGIPSDKGKKALRKKEQMVVDYFKKKFNIDFYKLQEVVAKNVKKMLI